MPKSYFSSTEATYAFEYDGCDSGRAHCTGKVVGSWLIDSNGLCPTDATPRSVSGERRGMWFRHHQVHFHIAPDGDWIVLASMAGPRAGLGGRYLVVPKGDGYALEAEGPHWRA